MDLTKLLRKIFGRQKPQPQPAPTQPHAPGRFLGRICLIVIDPICGANPGSKLTALTGWHDPDALIQDFISDLREVSYGYAQYQIVERIQVDTFPRKQDGFQYSDANYLGALRHQKGFHQPDAIDYHALLNDHQIIEKINQNLIDEVWTISFPWAGFYESRMAGPGAYQCNAPPLENTDPAARRFIIMAFNYERGVGEMLESYGHRAEAILSYRFQGIHEPENLWRRFNRCERWQPGQAEVGSIHYAPNSRQDYEWGNPTPVLSRCRNWRSFPNLSAPPQWVTCNEWGGGDIRAHHRWWFSLLPHVAGSDRGISYNWWEYIVDPNRYP